MTKNLDFTLLKEAVAGVGAAFRCRTKLQPAGGEGTKVFPPTYAGAVYATEKRRLPGHEQPVECVLLDSVQSQANRMEEALQQAIDGERFKKAGVAVPLVEVNFTPYWDPDKEKTLADDIRLLDPVGKVSSLQAPHRIADAILRDSLVTKDEHGEELDKPIPFRQSELGKRIGMVSARNATALYELCPTALLFGMWDSTGPKGGLGAKFERAIVSEIVGINAVFGVKTSSRIDPLAIQLKAGPLYVAANTNGIDWTLEEGNAKRDKNKAVTLGKDGRPSEANHGNIVPSLSDRDRETKEYLAGGVTITSAEQTVVLSLPALRRLRFPVNGEYSNERDDAGRTVLVALGLCAASLAAENGLDLRSRCLLWPTDPLRWELLGKPGEKPTTLDLSADAAIQLLADAVAAANALKLPWRTEPLHLEPSSELVKLVVKSQELALKQSGEGSD